MSPTIDLIFIGKLLPSGSLRERERERECVCVLERERKRESSEGVSE